MLTSSSIRHRRPVRIAGPLMLLTLTTCTGTMVSGAIERAYCGYDGKPGLYVPVLWSTRDTPESIEQNKDNNAVYLETCTDEGAVSLP